MEFKLKISDYEYLNQNAPDAINQTELKNTNNKNVTISISNFSDFAVELTFSILEVGMDDEDTVNEIGKRLYNIYDELLYQKKNN